jgi:hypothetical protein
MAAGGWAMVKEVDGCQMKLKRDKKMNRQVLLEQTLIEKIRSLSPEKIAQLEDFVDFLRQREQDRHLVRASAKLSESAFQKIWDNPDDADYDRL